MSGLELRNELSSYNAVRRFGLAKGSGKAVAVCISGAIMKGIKKPHDCPAFGTSCTPEHPVGAPMVSNEGACSAYYRYRARATAGVLASADTR
jgi:hydrogenase expression/formation protein HypD